MLLLHFYISFLFKTIQTQTKRVSGTTILWSTLSSSWQWVCASVQCCAVLCWCVPSRCNWTWWMVWRCPGLPSPCCAGPWLPEVRGCEQLPADQSPGEVTREAQCCGHRWSADILLRGRDIIMRLFRDIGPLHRMDPRISNRLSELLKLNQKFALALHHPIPNNRLTPPNKHIPLMKSWKYLHCYETASLDAERVPRVVQIYFQI